MNRLRTSWKAARENLDSAVALTLAVVVSIGGMADVVGSAVVTNATLATLAVLAVSSLRQRRQGQEIKRSLTEFEAAARTGNGCTADSFFGREQSDLALLDEARETVILVQETGSLVSETGRKRIVAILRSGGSLTAVLAAADSGSAALLALRNANLKPRDIEFRTSAFMAQLADIVSESGATGNQVQVRWLPYPVDATFLLVDSNSPNARYRRGLVRLAGYRVPFSDKLDFVFDAAASPRTFDHYLQEHHRLFVNAHKVILIEGPPRAGKTTLLTQLVEQFRSDEFLYYLLTPARIRIDSETSERIGFDLSSTDQPTPRAFANRLGPRNYEVVGNALAESMPLLVDAARSGKVVVLDEIGPLQLQQPGFLDMVERLIDEPSVTLLGAISQERSAQLDRLRNHPRVTVVQLGDGGASLARMSEELRCALRTARYAAMSREAKG